MIPYEDMARTNATFHDDFSAKFTELLKTGWFVLGNEVKAFETEFANFNGSKHCVGVGNGLDALILALKALKLPMGSEVIVPSNTYIASILAVIHAGLTPIMVEPNLETYNIDPTKIEAAITTKTSAILVVHLYGKCCEMDPILAIQKRYQLALVEDCAQSHMASYKGQMSGTFGNAGGFSFYPTKNLGALADAGAVLCNDGELAEAIKSLRNYGSKVKYHNDLVGYNSRLDEVQAAFLRIKLRKLSDITAHKRKLAALYLAHLKSDFVMPQVHHDYFDVYHIFNIRHARRDDLKAFLLEKGIATEIHYPVAPHLQKAMNGIFDQNLSFPIAEEIHRTTLSLPCSFCHSEDDVYHVIETLNSF